jgi:cbb3-type cytochrome oxidase subunit 3
LIITAAALRSADPGFYAQALQALWMVILIGVTYFWYRERERQIAAKKAPVLTADPEEESEGLLPDLDNGILSALNVGDKESSTIFQWLQISKWEVSGANEMYNRVRALQEQGYIARTERAYQITEEGRNRLLRDRARRKGTQVFTTRS